ncbi:MAG: zinc-dependent peptidase [Sulfuricurvum sp.]|nr:zinc-dependent peptidase [Sulfuricurvum sp.]MDD5387480.1 zinc-dependent peptidase [Sulfuricurvum sp.]
MKFAHEIDFMDGEIDGVPPIEQSKYELLGAYAASNEAEFFAVVTERFFESPVSLKLHFPELYDEFKDFYMIDTTQLFS